MKSSSAKYAAIWLVAHIVCFAADPQVRKTIELAPPQAAELLIKKLDPVYTPLAKAARLQGAVKIQCIINEAGDPTNLKVLSGHPFLVGSALDAVKHWKYKPYVENGRAVPFSTVIELAFSLGIPEEQYKSEEARAQAYFNQQDECRDLLTAARFGEAEISCRKAAELAELAPAERVGRYFAYQQVGHAFFYQRKFAEALTWYQRELEVADAKLKTDNAELGYAYRDVAFARHGNGDLEHAEPYYRRALQILEEAREHIRSEFLKNEYSRIMKNMLQPYAMLLRETGQLKEAEAMEQRANAIVIKEGLKDD